MNEAPELSIVIPMHNESAVVDALFSELLAVLAGLALPYEIICIDDGSSDDTLAKLQARCEQNPAIKAISLSRGFGKEAATTCGLDFAIGSAVVVMDADLQDPPQLITEFVAKWREGYQVVYGARRSRDGDDPMKRWTAKTFYRVFNRLSDTPIPPDAGDFRLMDRAVVEVLNDMPEQARFMKGIFAWAGFRQTGVPYDRPERAAGESGWPYLKLFRFALDGIYSFSTVPLRVWTWVGSVVAALSLLYALFLIVRTVLFGIDVAGYASLMVAVLFLGGVQLISIGVLGEYIGRIFAEAKARPLYVVNRTVGMDENRPGDDA